MKQYPAVPRAADAPDLFESGHLWLQERIDGAHLRFRMRESGVLQFGDRERTFDRRRSSGAQSGGSDGIPLGYRHAVRHVRESFDREALRNTVADPSSVVFFGEATVRDAIDYDWSRTPAFLGFDVWDADRERFLPPDSVEQIFERLGLRPVNTVQKEVRAVDFDPESDAVPDSAWHDGPAAGVVVRNKTGGRAEISHPAYDEWREESDPATAPADELAAQLVTRRRVERVVADLDAEARSAAFETVFERLLESVAREEHHRLFHDRASVDLRAFRSAAAERTQELLNDR
ncbi:RNA ligase family protein [Halorussus gelatinilyticus]|uniref:RNA ligase family protein n=1 Tax=Halorussus gelatinilyticus TaxID=2937524 RepID=A0A8U0IN08_9EURY|nr:RNA ligase family protein [Halorussus gelatinilyticus]UPW02015.1 RNA ligase family protein [Halorussus gelatinilyticus]